MRRNIVLRILVIIRPALRSIVCFAVCACAVAPENCNPDDVPTSFHLISCMVGGGSRARVESQKEDVARIATAGRLEQREADQLERDAGQLASQVVHWQEEFDKLDAQLVSLNDSIRRANNNVHVDQQRLQMLSFDLFTLQQSVNAYKRDSNVGRKEIAMLAKKIEYKRRLLHIELGE